MVKPQLNLDKKEDVKTPDGSFVKVVTTTEPLPAKQDAVPPPATTRRGCRCAKVICALLSVLLLTILMFMVIMHFFAPAGYYRCGVGYYDNIDDQYYEDYSFDSWSSEFPMPYGNDMLIAPRPTGAPLLRYLEEGVHIDLELQVIRINTPTRGQGPGVSVVHDFERQMSAYRVPSSEVCYIRPLNFASTLTPEEFKDLLDSEAYRNQEFPSSREVYIVDPEEQVMGVGEHIEKLCGEYTSYYMHSVPTDQLPAFWETARQLVREHLPRLRQHSDSSSSSEEEGRRHGDRHHGSGSRERSRSSSEEAWEGQDRARFMRSFVDNLRSFDGQQVVNIHVFEVHNLKGLTEEDLARLNAYRQPIAMP